MTEMLFRYRSHKEVRAAKIAAIEFERDGSAKIATADGYAPDVVNTRPGYRDRYKGGYDGDPGFDLGYYVKYADDYESWSPTRAFKEGYTRVQDALDLGAEVRRTGQAGK